jgi:MoaA/NifB/PqqE/SkfB family radical SAM enzyme
MTNEETRSQPLAEAELPIIHFVLNTDCNAWALTAPSGSPGVCRFCYRERNRVVTDVATVRLVLDLLRQQSAARRLVFTGGDPLMPYDNHLEVALGHAKQLGFTVNLHTNGLLLQERYEHLRDWVDVYSLAVDGPDAATADWYRGHGYFDRFRANLTRLCDDRRTLAFNTFTSPRNIDQLRQIAELILEAAQRTTVEYWLISQYRPIGRADARKATIYGYTAATFTHAVTAARSLMGSVRVFAQPTRRPTDPYPFRIWVLADGTVTADLGSVAAPRNEILGNVLQDGLVLLVRRALALRETATQTREDTSYAR